MRWRSWLVGMVAGWCLQAGATEVVVYNPYLTPPFVYDNGGLASEVVAWLNRQPGHFHFTLQTLPKARLMGTTTEQGDAFAGLILFQMPAFMGDAVQQKFYWSKPLYSEENVLVFSGRTAMGISRVDDLQGMSMGRVRGHSYRSLAAMLDSNQLHSEEVNDEETNLRKLKAGRIDFTQLARSVYVHYSKRPEFAGLFSVREAFEPPVLRQLAVGKANPALYQWVTQLVQRSRQDSGWQRIMQRYQLTPYKE